MAKQKKIIISSIIFLCLMLFSIITFFYINKCSNTKITFTINDNLPDGNNKKATIILLGGQSNASGCSSDKYLQKKSSIEKYLEYQNGYENIYINYYSSGKNQSD